MSAVVRLRLFVGVPLVIVCVCVRLDRSSCMRVLFFWPARCSLSEDLGCVAAGEPQEVEHGAGDGCGYVEPCFTTLRPESLCAAPFDMAGVCSGEVVAGDLQALSMELQTLSELLAYADAIADRVSQLDAQAVLGLSGVGVSRDADRMGVLGVVPGGGLHNFGSCLRRGDPESLFGSLSSARSQSLSGV